MTTYEKLNIEKDGLKLNVDAKVVISEEKLYEAVFDYVRNETYNSVEKLFDMFGALKYRKQIEFLNLLFPYYINPALTSYKEITFEDYLKETVSEKTYQSKKERFLDKTTYSDIEYVEEDFQILYALHKALQEIFK